MRVNEMKALHVDRHNLEPGDAPGEPTQLFNGALTRQPSMKVIFRAR